MSRKKKPDDFKELLAKGGAKETAGKPKRKFKLTYVDEGDILHHINRLQTHLGIYAKANAEGTAVLMRDLKNLRDAVGVVSDRLWNAERPPKDPRKPSKWPKIVLQWKGGKKRHEKASTHKQSKIRSRG